MTSSARDEADCKEFFDDECALNLKIKSLAELIRNPKHFCAFTGAGISTAAGIADFRSGINTVLDTGAGKWAKNAAVKQGKSKQIKKPKRSKKSIKAIPTASHMALVSLATSGCLKHLISQNTDGLHRRSGFPVDRLSELHGNTTLEVCDKCGRGYMRDYRCRNSLRKQKVHDHKTGRFCTVPKCRGNLNDTIINFGENLPEMTLETAESNASECDVMLALGSSLTVTPAADLPEEVGDKWAEQKSDGKRPTHHLVIVNLQKTPLDEVCSLRIFAKIDEVMVPLMKELGLDIPEWALHRFMRVAVRPSPKSNDLKTLTITAVDVDGITATVFKNLELMDNGKSVKRVALRGGNENDFAFVVPAQTVEPADESKENDASKGLVAEMSFFGNYSEPDLRVPLCPYFENLSDGEFVCRLTMDIASKQWTVAPLTVDHGGDAAVEEAADALQSADLLGNANDDTNE